MLTNGSTKPMFSKFSNVVCINIDGKNLKDPKVISDINKQVEAKVKVIVNELKTTHAKFVDVDFGPKEDDEFGATSLYGPANKTPEPAGSKYPSPDTLRWDRPLYDDDNFEEDEEKKDGSDDEDQAGGDDVYGEGEGNDDEFGDDNFAFQGGDDDQDGPWCKHGSLFIDGASSGDVIQGTLGDCWFLGAMAVMGANESLLKDCFWNADSFKNYGLFVVRFFKDVQIIYVIIDDRIPVKIKDGRVIFGSCKDPNELWVPLMEKAYAKLHGSYRGLIAGWLHHGLSDMTGYCSKLVTLKPGYPGYNEKLDADEVWNLIERYKSWGCLMGTSIQADHRQERKVEMEAGMGLLMGHAYSFLGLGSIDDANAPGGHVRLVKLRNPWGRGEWEGAYGDRTEERERAEIQNEIEKNFKVGHEDITINFMDGSFFMPFDAWFSRFTSLMVAVNFPNHWFGRRLQGFWSGEKGGNRNMGSWISNDKIKMNIKGEKGTYKHVFIGLYTHDSRLTLGKEYYLDPVYSCPLAFDVVTANDFDKDPKERQIIPGSSKHLPTLKKPAQPMHQAPYNNGDTQIECYLQAGVDYFILPFLYNRQQPGAYYITVYAENDFELEGGVKVSGESQLMVVGAKVSDAVKASHVSVDVNAGDKTTAHWSNPQAVLDSMPDARLTTTSNSSSEALVTVANKEKVLSISKAQFYEKAEQLRSRFVLEAKRLGVSLAQVKSIFASDRDVSGKDMKRSTYSQFKRRLMDIGFSLTDLPDEDLVVLDIDNSGSISPNEFLDFFELGLSFDEGVNMPIPPPPPVDDLLFKAADLEGVLRVNVIAGRAMRQPAAWFQKSTDGETNSKYEDKATTSQSSSGTEGSNEFKDRKVLQYHKEGRKFCYENIFHDHSSSSSTAAAANSASSNSKQDNHGNEEVKIADNTPDSPIHGTVALNNTKKINSGGSISGGSTMTTTSKRAGENIAQNSGIQLHTDPELVEAEIQRALLMQSFRKTLQNGDILGGVSGGLTSSASFINPHNNAASELEKAGTLRKREKTRSKVEKRNIRSDMYSLSFLNKRPELVIPLLDGSDDYPAMRYSYAIQGKICPIPVNNNSSSSSSTYGKRESDSVPALHKHDTIRITNPLAHIGHGGGGESNRFTASTTNSLSDIWDLIIQRVIIISDSRIGTRSHQGKGQSLPAAFSLIKEKRGPLDRSLFLPFLGSQENSSYAAGKGDNANNGNGSERSTIVTPKVGIEKSFRKGTTPTPRNLKKFPGWASVQTSKQQQQSQQKGGIYGDSSIAGSTAHATAHATISQAADKIRENQKGQFVEIYRRLVHIPVISNHERAGDRLRHSSEDTMSGSYLSAFAKRLFAKFDKNMNGFISLEEFKESLLEMNINVSEEDTLTLFNRFETRQKDGTIDWNEFLDFFHSHIVKDIITDWDVDGTDDVVRRSIIDILLEIRRCLAPIIQQMKSRGWRSVEEYLTRTAKGRRRSVVDSHSHSTALIDANNSTGLAEKENTNKLSDNCLFHHLNTAHAARNRALLNQLGVKVDIEDMKRVNRVFARNVTAFMAFLQGEESHRLDDIMTEAHKRVISGFENRVGVNSSGEYGNALNNNTILKLWSIICSQKSTLKYDEMVSIVEDILLKSLDTDSRRAKKMNTMTNSTPRSDGGDSLAKNQPNISSKESLKNITAASPSLEKSSSSMLAANEDDSDNADENHIWINENFHGIHAELVSRCVTDMITQSAWNKSEIDSSDVDPTSNSVIMHSNNVSYSAFEAYVRYGHVNAIETKLKYLLQLEMSIAGPKIYSLVHTYINQERTEMIILVHEPLSGDVTSISIKEDFSSLPSPYELEEMCKKKCIENNKSIDVWASGRRYVYTPLETPAEDLAIWNIITRLRIVRTASARAPNELFMAEDPRLVNQINLLMDAALDLPFFCTCSDISLYFEVDSEQLNQARNIKNGNIGTGLKPLVFSAIRKSKALHSYLVNIMADLNVILTSYNSGVRITMSWKELIAHLTDYRNPYVTAELKPRFLEPHEYVYKPHESTSAYDGEEDNDPLAVQQSSVVMDGGTHPTFDCTFAIKFRPPKLTACKLLSTEIHKMDINGELKFVILMVREAKRTSSDRALKAENESFRFLTIYDPRNATDYQCGVKQGCDLYRVLCGSETDDSQENSPWFNSPENQTLEKFMEMVSTAADNNMILLGPAITPRLILTVLNQRGRHVEVLGHCQMSISAVLSGSGVVKPSWNTLTYMEEDNNGKEMLISAGELHVEMGFRKLSEIKSEIQAEKARLIRRKEQRTPVGTPIMRPMLSRSSASAPPTSAAAAAAERTEKMTSDSTKEPSSVSENNFAVSKDSIKQSEIEAPLSSSSSSAAAAAAAAELEELNKALQIAQSKVDRSNQLEHDIKLSEARLKELEIVKKAQEDTILALQLQVQEQSVILENKEKALQEQESLTLALKEKEKEKVKEPVKPATVSQTTKSPRQSQKKLDKEISVSASASASANELKELAELRAYVELVKLENDRRAEIDSKKEKDMKKLASQLQKQKEAAAKEKAVLEEQLAKEIFEREKIVKTATAAAAGEKKKKQSDSMTTIGGGGGGAGGSGTAAVKELSSSTPITSKEKKAGHGKDRDRDRASRGGAAVDMSVSGNAYSSSSDTGTGTGTVSLPNTSTSATGGGANSITFNKNNTAPTRDLDFEHEQKQRSQTTEQDQHAHIHQVPAIPPVTTSMDWSTIPLPNGWESKKDENTGRYFYVDHVNKKTQWRHPLYVKNKN